MSIRFHQTFDRSNVIYSGDAAAVLTLNDRLIGQATGKSAAVRVIVSLCFAEYVK